MKAAAHLALTACAAAIAATPAAAVTTIFSGNLDGSLSYQRPAQVNGPPPWGTSGSTFNYFTESFTPAGSGDFDVAVTGGSIHDPVMYLYLGSFDPGDTDLNGINANDDGGVGLMPAFDDEALTGGQRYVIVVTSFSVGDTGTLDFEIIGPFGVQVGLPLTSSTTVDAVLDTGTPSSLGAATTLDALAAGGASGDMALVLATLDALTGQRRADAAERTTPVLAGGNARLGGVASDAFSAVISERIAATSGVAAGDPMLRDRAFWVRPFAGWTEQQRRGGVAGYDVDTHGVALGADAEVGERWRVGLAVGYSRGNADSTSAAARQNVDIDSYHLRAYGRYTIDARMAVDVQAGAGFSDYGSTRNIVLGPLNRIAAGDYDGWHAHVGAEIERAYALGAATTALPYAGARFSHASVEGYRETGANALNLVVEDDRARSLIARAGVKLVHAATRSLTLTANAGAGYDLLSERSRLTSSFAGGGASFTTVGIKPDPVVYEAGAAVRYAADNGLELSARYNFSARDDYTDQSVALNLRWAF